MSLQVTRGPVWTIQLNRPEVANALNADLVESLHDVLDQAEAERPDAIVVRGNDRHFASGFDLAGIQCETDGSLALRFLRIGLLLERLESTPFLTIAVIEGPAIGAGADLALACDHRIGNAQASFRFPGTGFGVVLGTRRLARIAGAHRALEGSRPVRATEAAGIGLLTTLTDRPSQTAEEVLRRWQQVSPHARPSLLVQARTSEPDTSLAALARSVAAPGLRERLISFAMHARTSPTGASR